MKGQLDSQPGAADNILYFEFVSTISHPVPERNNASAALRDI